MKTISFVVFSEFDRQLRIVAAGQDLNRSEFIRQILEENLKHQAVGTEFVTVEPSLRSINEKGSNLPS